jgi:hypothetical protein
MKKLSRILIVGNIFGCGLESVRRIAENQGVRIEQAENLLSDSKNINERDHYKREFKIENIPKFDTQIIHRADDHPFSKFKGKRKGKNKF